MPSWGMWANTGGLEEGGGIGIEGRRGGVAWERGGIRILS